MPLKFETYLKLITKNMYPLIKHRAISLITKFFFKKLSFMIDYHFKNGYSSPPFSLHVGVTDQCNLRCKMCYYANTTSAYSKLNTLGMMNFQVFKKLIREIKGKPVVMFTGGEPLLHPKIEDFIKEAKKKGMICAMNTNATLLKQKAKNLVNAGLDYMVVSLDGTEKTNDYVRGVKGTFKKVADGIEEMSKYKDRPFMGVNFAVSNLNYLNMKEFFREAEKLKVHFINFNMLWQRTPKMIKMHNRLCPEFKVPYVNYQYDNKKIDFKKLKENIEWVKNRKTDKIVNFYPNLNGYKDIITYYTLPEKFLKIHLAKCPWINFHISPNADVILCGDIVFGNLKENNVNEIWNNERFRLFRNKMKKSKAFPICPRCCGFFELDAL